MRVVTKAKIRACRQSYILFRQLCTQLQSFPFQAITRACKQMDGSTMSLAIALWKLSEQRKIKFAASMCLQAECMQRVTRHPDEHGPDASAFYENMPVRALRGDRCQL